MDDLNAYWLEKGTEQLRQACAGAYEITYDVSALPDTWLAAELLTFDEGTEWEYGAAHIIGMPRPLAAHVHGDVVVLLDAAEGTRGDARIAALEAAWRACGDPQLAAVIEALDAQRDAPAMPVAKKKRETELRWAEAAKTALPRSVFAGEWPKTWRDAQRRMRAMYQRPRSPLLAAAALELAMRDPLPYTSIAATTFWQAFAWFIAEQGDLRQLEALVAFETRLAPMWGDKRIASDALRGFTAPKLAAAVVARIAALAAPPTPAKRLPLSLASADERAVAADQLLLAGDPRGELITVQAAIATEPTPALLKRQAQLVRKHAKTWVPGTVYRDTCVFRGGVPVAGHLIARSDPELASMAGSRALATFETLIVDEAFAMGDIDAKTIARVVASLPALRTVGTTHGGAVAIAKGPATAIARIALETGRENLEGPGLLQLVRIDVPDLDARWRDQPWLQRLEAIGIQDPQAFVRWQGAGLPCMLVLTDALAFLHRRTPSAPTPWELWADREGIVTAKPQVGSTADSLVATLWMVPWQTVKTLRVPKNYVAGLEAFASEHDVDIAAGPAVEIAAAGISLDLA